MKTKLISTGAYLLLIDEEAEVKLNDYWYNIRDNKFDRQLDFENTVEDIQGGQLRYYFKILAYYPLKEAKELDLPLFPNPFEEELDFSKWYETQYYPQSDNNSDPLEEEMTIETFKWSYMSPAFEAGYKAAQSKQYSLEDMKKAIEMARSVIETEERVYEDKYSDDEIIQSLSTQQLPVSFTPEYYTNGDLIVKNRDGIRTLIGTYKY